eukprot:gene29863-39028_t
MGGQWDFALRKRVGWLVFLKTVVGRIPPPAIARRQASGLSSKSGELRDLEDPAGGLDGHVDDAVIMKDDKCAEGGPGVQA